MSAHVLQHNAHHLVCTIQRKQLGVNVQGLPTDEMPSTLQQFEEVQPCSLEDVGTPVLELFLKKDANGEMQQQGTVLSLPPDLLSQAQSSLQSRPPYYYLLCLCHVHATVYMSVLCLFSMLVWRERALSTLLCTKESRLRQASRQLLRA